MFDFLIAVIFDEGFNILEMWKVPRQFVKEKAKWSEHSNGHIFQAKPDILVGGKGVERIV